MADHKEAKKAEYVLLLKKIGLMYLSCSRPQPYFDVTGHLLVEPEYAMNIDTESLTVSLLSPIGFSVLLVYSSCDLYQVCNGCKSSMVANAAFDQPPVVELTSQNPIYSMLCLCPSHRTLYILKLGSSTYYIMQASVSIPNSLDTLQILCLIKFGP